MADFADVAGAESPGLAGDHGGGDLSAVENVGGAEFDLGAGGRDSDGLGLGCRWRLGRHRLGRL